jgi:anti-sigma factor RsiW
MDKDIAQLLSFYVNGTLTGAERDRVEVALRDDPRARALLEWEKSLRKAVQNDPQFDIAEDRGLAQVMQRIKAETKAAPAQPARKSRASAASGGGSFAARFREWFQWSPALALACGIVAVQLGVIVHMASIRGEESEYAGVRAMKGRQQDAFVRISFKPESAEIDLRALLREVNAEIVSGPSQLGDYYLVVRASGVQAVLTTLQANSIVESAEIVRELPPRPM